MYRFILVALIMAATAVWAQDDAAETETVAEEVETSVDELSEEEQDDLDLDDQDDHTEDDDDVFRPTDVVSYQQSVPFPVDI